MGSNDQTGLRNGRANDKIRPVQITPGYIDGSPNTVLYRSGMTQVLCVASLETGIPPWLSDDQGWLTAEYSLLPYSTRPRNSRPRDGRVDGRSQEIQRLIGRALRASLDRTKMPGHTIRIDCDVLYADGGTRTASIAGATVALGLAIKQGLEQGRLAEDPRVSTLAAISVGLCGDELLLDLDYREDSAAQLDLNVVGTTDGRLVEIQGASESTPIAGETWQGLLELGLNGLRQVGSELAQHVFPHEA